MKKHVWAYLAAVVLIGLFLAQAVGNLSAQSPVVDEPSHIARAMAYWRAGDLRLQLGHPPLIHALAGLPLLLEPGIPKPENLPNWQPLEREKFVGHALWDEGRPTDRIVFQARWVVLMLALVLGALIFRWAGERVGVRAALAALCLFAFDPNLLAHSVLVTTDLGVTFFILLAVYTFDRWMQQPSCGRLAIVSITFGLAMTAKFSAVILIPVMTILAAFAGWRKQRVVQTLGALALIFALGTLVIWAVYRFEVGPCRLLPINVPAPTLWDGLVRLKEREEEGRMAFLLGQMSPRGWWYYFPIALAVKTPVPTLLSIGAAIVGSVILAWRARRHREHRELELLRNSLTLWLLPVLYLGVAMQSSQNIGYRHLLPILPFLFLWISDYRLWNIDKLRFRWVGAVSPYILVCILLVWYVIGAALIYPYHLAYFNEIAGGPDNGHYFLADSNLDWGQDIKRLKAWLDANRVAAVYLSVFSGSQPERYGIRVLPLPGQYQSPDEYGFRRFAPTPGVYVISVSSWLGLRFHNPDTFDWFRHQKPVARIGHSLFVYKVNQESAAAKWAAVCYAPDGPIDGDGLAAGFGRQEMRSIFFDCRDAWVYLGGGGPGYYIIPARGDPTIADEMMLGRAVPIYRDRGNPAMPKDEPGFTLYRWDGETEVLAIQARLVRPPGGAFDFGPATLIGYELEQGPFASGSVVRLMTWWQVSGASKAALSVYAHVMDGERLVTNHDGLGVPAQTWQPGDVIVQQHILKLPPDLPPGEYTLHVGLYHTPDGPRLPLQVVGQRGDEHPILTTLRVVSK